MFKKIIFFMAFGLLVLSTCFAGTYQNRDYNFQMEIPDNWIDAPNDRYLVSKKIIINQGDGNQEWAGFVFDVTPDKNNSDDIISDDFVPEQRREILNSMIDGIVKKYPTAKITYSDYLHFGNNGFLVVKATVLSNNNTPIKFTYTTTMFHRMQYFSILVTGDKGNYEQQFFGILETLRSIY